MPDHVEAQEGDIPAVEERIEAALAPFVGRVELLTAIPGVDHRSAQVILAGLGPDMAAFPTAGHLASWAGMYPGQRDCAGRPGSGKTRKGSTWVTRSPGPVRQRALTHQGQLLSERYRQVVPPQ